jgi:hypothetical protein
MVDRRLVMPIILLLAVISSIAYAQNDETVMDLTMIRLVALLTGIIAAVMAWRWYFSSLSKPPILLWFGFGMVSELLIKWFYLSLSPAANSPAELLIAGLQVASGAFFLTGLWAFLCTRWIKANPALSKQFLLILALVIAGLLFYGVMNGRSGDASMIIYAIYVMTSFWMLLYVFITLMALYAYIRTDEMMLAWFSAGFSMMVFASWYRLLFVQEALLPEQQVVSSLLPLINSVCYIVGVFLFQRAGKA